MNVAENSGVGRFIRFELPVRFLLLNQTRRLHWAKLRQNKAALAWEIRIALKGNDLGNFSLPFARARVRIERHSSQAPDKDGLYGGAKELIDLLLPVVPKRRPMGFGFVVDDGPTVMDQTVVHIQSARSVKKTVVMIEEVLGDVPFSNGP